MPYANGNYTAFYVSTPFKETNLGANITKDFCYYRTLQMWKGADSSFPFINSHDKTYDVRDSSDWESTLKPRLRKRLANSKNIILILSKNTKSSRALNEEMDYGINTLKLPIIVVYPDFKNQSDIKDYNNNILEQVQTLWDNLPSFRDNMSKVPTLHIPFNKDAIERALLDNGLMKNTAIEPDIYVLN